MDKARFPIPNILTSLRAGVITGDYTIDYAAQELQKAGWTNAVDTESTALILGLLYRYYTTQRPPEPGAIPRGAERVKAYDWRTFEPEIGREAYGYAEYRYPLKEQEISDYELTPSPKNKSWG